MEKGEFVRVKTREQDENLHVVGRAALLRRPRIQGRAAALPYQEGEKSCRAPAGGEGFP